MILPLHAHYFKYLITVLIVLNVSKVNTMIEFNNVNHKSWTLAPPYS